MSQNNPNNTPSSGGSSGEPPRIVSASGSSEIVPTQNTAPLATERVETVSVNNDAEDIAARYVHKELKQARKGLQLTQIIGGLSVLGTALYLGYITYNIQKTFEPDAAAQVATGIIGQKVDEQSQQLADQAKQRVPQLIAQLPDYAIKQMPGYREKLETQIDSDLNTNMEQASKQMDGHFDAFVSDNKTQIAALLKDSNDKQATHALGTALQGEMQKFLKQTPVTNGETAQSKLDQTLTALQQVDKQIARLAAGKNLSPQEQKMRRAIAVISGGVEKGVKDNGLTLPQAPA